MYIDWYCDGCDAELNRQKDFTTSSGNWICTNCGYNNDVTESNILTEAESEIAKSFQSECPNCGGHMAMGQGYVGVVWVCENCGCEAQDDGYGNLIYEVDDDTDDEYDGEENDDENYCNICEHNNEYPGCIGRCPYSN